jgi:PAS domain S-box-containing protein
VSAHPERAGPVEAAPAGGVDRYRTLFELAPVAALVTDGDGRIVEANVAAARLLDVPVRFLVGKPVQAFVEKRDVRALRHFVSGIRADAPTRVEIRLRRRSGVAFDVAVEATAGGSELFWVLQDVSQRKLVEAQLWELNRALEEEVQRQSSEIVTVLDELPVGVVVVDAATLTIRRANARAQEIVGVGEGDAVGAVEALDAKGRVVAAAERPSAVALAGRRVDGARLLIPRPDGAVREVEVSAVPLLDTKGAVTGAALTIDDVTERGRRERAERDFVSNAAHQLRSPLTAMTGAVAVLRSSPNLDEATRTRFLDHIERETDRMVRLTHGLLTLARVERDEVRPRPTVVPVRPLLAGLAEDASGAVISVEADDEAAVVANEELLVEALTNLVGNAVRHGGGRVALRGLRVDDDVVLEVADSGPGMTPEVLERVFDRFYRAEGVRTGGFGLGLPIARAAARAAGGDLTLESAAGAGTTARIRLMGAKLL